MRRPIRGLIAAVASATILAGCSGLAGPAASMPSALPGSGLQARIADRNIHNAVADGDLWPSCWGDDDALYAANGDGAGFGETSYDVAVSRITGGIDDLEGVTLAGGDAVGQVWSGEGFTRKPTGMVCVGGRIYLAVQDLRTDFNEAPAATIAVSDDHGRSWTWDRSAPMFGDHVFTTIMFLDYGKDAAEAPGDWVYAYGLDGNWRDSFDDSVADPQDLFLARVKSDQVLDRSAWQFFSRDAGGTVSWSSDIADRSPVLHDARRAHPQSDSEGGTVGVGDLSVISQGGIVYDAPLRRYLYTSWTELTYEFSEAPTPEGPWTLFLSKDFGDYPWTDTRYGGYATTVPSKFISADGRTAWVQSNVCPCAPAGMSSYSFGLRKLQIAPTTGG